MHVIGAYEPGWKVAIHGSCICNEIIALSNRHLIDRSYIRFNPGYFKRMCKPLLARLPQDVTPMSYYDIINHYSCGKKKVYIRALEKIRAVGYDRRWSYVKMFVKPDKYAESEIHAKAPRAIQYRDPAFNLLIARFLKPFEEQFYKSDDIAKGKNVQQRARICIEKYQMFEQPLVIMLDHSKFDSTVNVEHLKMKHKAYHRCFNNSALKNLLKCQLKNKGFSKNGIRYTIKGTVMSGDYDTGLGNTLINWLVLHSWCRKIKHEVFIDGDDSLVFIDRRDFSKLSFDHFEKMGFETKMEITTDLQQAEFCQSKIIFGQIPCFVRNPYRMISHSNVSLKRYPAKLWPNILAGRGICELVLNRGIPIGQHLGAYYLVPGLKPIWDPEDFYKFKINKDTVACEITDEARYSYYEAFGIDINQQLAIEQSFSNAKMKFNSYTTDEKYEQIFESWQSLPTTKEEAQTKYCNEF